MSIPKLQLRLKQLGLYGGDITGDANKELRAAIAAYREREMHDEEVDRLLAKRAKL
jgi:hypothetical protein